MKSMLCLAAALTLATPVCAHDDGHAHDDHHHAAAPQPETQARELDVHTREDIARHRGMARAHEQAAQCLEQGQPYEDCQKQLQTSCKGLALGKNCGMRHSH